MSALRAPVAIPVEIRSPASAGGEDRRVFRLAAAIGEDGVRLERHAPFEIGRPISARFLLPGGTVPLELDAEIFHADDEDERAYETANGATGGREVVFSHPSSEARAEIRAYVTSRLGLP